MNEKNELQPEKIIEQVSQDINIKNFRHSSDGFATKLWKILDWVDNSELRKEYVGIRWLTNDEFLIDKKRFCTLTTTPINTLNCKLRTYQFIQSRKRSSSLTFYKCELFNKFSTPDDLMQIDHRKNPNDANHTILPRAMYLPLLVSVRLYTTKPSEISFFKCDSIILWQEILGRESIWSFDRTYFINAAAERFCQPFNSFFAASIQNPILTSANVFQSSTGVDIDPLGGFNAQQTEFIQYITANDLDIASTARQMISYVLPTESEVITLRDFCMFYARFGPEDFVLEKIHQLLCCSKSYGDWFQPGEQVFDEEKSMSGSYSNTFANCFIIKRAQRLTYHVYNLINASTRSGFLIDETGKKFHTWHAVCECLNIPAPQPISYGGIYDQNDFAY